LLHSNKLRVESTRKNLNARVSEKIDTQTCENYTIEYVIHTHVCRFLNIFLVKYANNTCPSVILTLKSVISTRRVWFSHAQVWFPHTKCDFDTQTRQRLANPNQFGGFVLFQMFYWIFFNLLTLSSFTAQIQFFNLITSLKLLVGLSFMFSFQNAIVARNYW
jgi:hypothetical protein